MWAGLAPVFMKAVVQAVLNGPNRKPTYKVTLKTDDARWHWRHTLPQTAVIMTFAVVGITALRYGTYPSVTLLVGSVYWGALNVVLLANFVSRSWHGLALTHTFFGRRRPELDAETA
jgi:cellulose synthase (UDP-forming)